MTLNIGNATNTVQSAVDPCTGSGLFNSMEDCIP